MIAQNREALYLSEAAGLQLRFEFVLMQAVVVLKKLNQLTWLI